MNIVCAQCGAGVACESPSLANQTVVVCSACGTRSRVTIEAVAVPIPAPSHPVPMSATRRQALVAVQGEATRELIRELLASAGFDVIEAASGAGALAKVRDVHPGLVLVDVGLSDMPGFQVCEAVRGDSANIGIKMILVAAIHNKDRYRRPPDKLFGADDYIERHQIESQLIDKVNGLCGPCDDAETPAADATAAPARAREPESARRAAASAGPSRPAASPPPGVGAVATGLGAAVAREPGPKQSQAPRPPSPGAAQPRPPSAAPAPAGGHATAAAPPAKEVATANSATPAPPTSPAQEAALRLARIIVSDIALYNAKKVDEGVANGTFFDLLRTEIEEGRKLYEERKGPGLTTAVDLFQQTLDQFVATRRELLKRNRPAAA